MPFSVAPFAFILRHCRGVPERLAVLFPTCVTSAEFLYFAVPPVSSFYGIDNHHNSFKGNVGNIINNFLSVDIYCEPSRSHKEQGTLEEKQNSNSNGDS